MNLARGGRRGDRDGLVAASRSRSGRAAGPEGDRLGGIPMSDSDHEHVGSFADGQRTLPHTAADDIPASFSEGQEASHAAHLRMGSFADTSCP